MTKGPRRIHEDLVILNMKVGEEGEQLREGGRKMLSYQKHLRLSSTASFLKAPSSLTQ